MTQIGPLRALRATTLAILVGAPFGGGCSSDGDGARNRDAGNASGDGQSQGDGDFDLDSSLPGLPEGLPAVCADYAQCCYATIGREVCQPLLESLAQAKDYLTEQQLIESCSGCTLPDACTDSDVITADSLRAAKAALDSGENHVKLSTLGCTTFSRSVVGEAVVSESLSHGQSGSSERALFAASYGASEATISTSLGGVTTWKALAASDGQGEISSLTLETNMPVEGTLLRREVYTPSGADAFHVATEAPSTGDAGIVPLAEFEAPASQAVSFGPALSPAGVSTEGCSDEQTQSLENTLEQIVIDGFKCLDGKGRPDMASFVLSQYLSRKITFECKALGLGTDQIAQLAILGRMTSWLFGSFSITINTDRFFASDAGSDQTRSNALRRNVLFHELMHLYNGAHQPSIGGPRMTEWDRTYACAGTCFPLLDDMNQPTTTKCACATCLGKTVCDNECTEFKECDVNLGANCNALPPKWYATEMECAEACTESCETRDVDCDPCN